jgi:hypothetical protein
MSVTTIIPRLHAVRIRITAGFSQVLMSGLGEFSSSAGTFQTCGERVHC